MPHHREVRLECPTIRRLSISDVEIGDSCSRISDMLKTRRGTANDPKFSAKGQPRNGGALMAEITVSLT